MEPTPISTIKQHLADGNAIPMVRGTLKNLWDRKSGQGQKGDWSIQNGNLTDGNDTISVFIKDRDELPQDLRGQEIVVIGKETQHGLSGIYAMDDDYKGEVTRKLKITGSATIMLAADFDEGPGHPEARTAAQEHVGESDQEPPQGPDGWPSEDEIKRQHAMVAAHNAQKPAQGSAQRNPAPAPQNGSSTQGGDLTDAKRTIVQIANLHLLCRIAVERQEAPVLKELGRDMGEQERQAAASSLFIKADKLGLHTKMPTKPFTAADFNH